MTPRNSKKTGARKRKLATPLPGLDEALDYLARKTAPMPPHHTSLGEDDDDYVDPDGSTPAARRPTPDEMLDALTILRIHAALSGASEGLRPPRGFLTALIVPGSDDRDRVSALLPNMAMVGSEYGRVSLFTEWETPRGRQGKDIQPVIEAALLKGEGVVAILSKPDAVSRSLDPLVRARFILPPADMRMITALLDHLHPVETAPLPEIETLGEVPAVMLAPVFAAETRAEAVAYLTLLASKAGKAADGPTLKDVHGQPEAVEALAQVIQDLEAWQAGHIKWSEVTRSFVLTGPPGTGKTLLAEALAGSAGILFVKTSYAECQRKGHQGDMLQELTGAAERAIAGAPAVFFLDEIDSFYQRGQSVNGYIVGVVNGLLTLIDRLSATAGVILIAATNDINRVDSAVVRAGRFDRHIRIGPPDRHGIRSMLATDLTGIVTPMQLDDLAHQLLGLTGAEIAAMLRDARTRARARAGSLAAEDVQAAADAVQPRVDADLIWRVSVHESGHLVAGHLLGAPPATSARVTSRGGEVRRQHPPFLTPHGVMILLCELLAGRTAEEICFGEATSGAGVGEQSDLAQATRFALKQHGTYGFGPTLSWVAPDTPLALLPEPLRTRVEATLQQAQAEVSVLLQGHRALIDRVAIALAEHRELDAPAIGRLLANTAVLPANESDPPDAEPQDAAPDLRPQDPHAPLGPEGEIALDSSDR